MIYLLRTAGINTEHKAVVVLKIGYTDDLRGDGRFQDYKNAGMDIEILYTISGGNTYLEHELQRKFQAHRLPWKSLEWFEDCEEILKAFSEFNCIDDITNFLGYSNFEEFERINIDLKKSEKELYQESLDIVIRDFGEDSSVSEFYKSFISETKFPKRLESLCKFEERDKLLSYIPDDKFSQFLKVLGPDRCAAFSYRGYLLEKEVLKITNVQKSNIVRDKIYETFEIGEIYSLSEIKRLLSNIYESVGGLSIAAKSTDLKKYFNVRSTMILMNDQGERKKTKVLEILSIK